MNGLMLDRVTKDILRVVEPLQDDWTARFQVINELRNIVQSIESLRGATIEPFGSFVSNLFSRWGDLDLSVQLHNGSYISTAGKKRKQTLLRDIQKASRKKGGWCKLQLIPHARVPILKIEHIQHNISCDISIDNLVGQIKSKILLWLNEIDGRFHDMVLLVKEWAKAHDINNSKQGTFNSYSLSLLVIFHFQTCSPAIFPPLRDIYPGNVVDNLKAGVRAEVENEIAVTCATNIARFKSRTANRSSLSELFVSFLAKFSDISSKASELGICPFTGQWLEIECNMRWLPKTYAIFVEDPFEQPENTARAINARQLTRISEAFRMTHLRLTSVYQNQSSILNDLARPQILQLIMNSSGSASAPAFNVGNYPPIRPQVHQARVMQPRPWIQHQFQNDIPRFNMGNFPPINSQAPHAGTLQSQPPVQHKMPKTKHIVSSPNVLNVGEPSNPSKIYSGQGQQKWRPRSQRQVL
ncbi:protein HESO1 isoform X1 [Cucumis melo]|uniref:Protein HESO1 isoform X1 n=1 Tax=Cucumis melo TaxID=3656 RepID=A0A1S3CFC1_CUCME|nr:protein HESO1 isoform X1 [Cucumis melo]XP_008461704.2 protein HESO1 isoform X1 [Cucumis melo]